MKLGDVFKAKNKGGKEWSSHVKAGRVHVVEFGELKTPVPTESQCLPTNEETPGCLTCGGALLQAQVSAQAVGKLSFCHLSVFPLRTDWKQGEVKSLPYLCQRVCLSVRNGNYYSGPQLFRVWYPLSPAELQSSGPPGHFS